MCGTNRFPLDPAIDRAERKNCPSGKQDILIIIERFGEEARRQDKDQPTDQRGQRVAKASSDQRVKEDRRRVPVQKRIKMTHAIEVAGGHRKISHRLDQDERLVQRGSII